MRPSLGYSNLSWVTQDKMKKRREDAKKIKEEVLEEPKPIETSVINQHIPLKTEQDVDSSNKTIIKSEASEEHIEKVKVHERVEKKEPKKINKDD